MVHLDNEILFSIKKNELLSNEKYEGNLNAYYSVINHLIRLDTVF